MSVQVPKQQAPDYKLTRPKDPPGAMTINLTIIDGLIVMDFAAVVEWVGLMPDQAEKLGNELLEAVRHARTLHVVGG